MWDTRLYKASLQCTQGLLCTQILKMDNVMKNVVSTVNFIRSKGLNHRQFQPLLSEVGSEYIIWYYLSQSCSFSQ